MKISACLVIRNEEKILSRCLESIKDIADEIIIVHDGPCNDKSLDISKKYQAKIYVRSLIGVAEPHRPFTYEKATGDWILQIDADEFLSAKAQNEIRSLILEKSIDAYSFSWPYSMNNQYITVGPFANTLKSCLFRKNKLYMLGIAQEYPRTYGILQKRGDILLEHKPEYDNFTLSIFRQKWVKWAKLQAIQISNIEKTQTFNISNASESQIIRHYLFIRKHPILTGLTETGRFLLIYILRGILWSGWGSLKIAYFELTYIWLVKKYLEDLKYGRKI